MSSCTGIFANVDIQQTGEIKPMACVWEITLACNLRCEHCGSRAGRRRGEELDTDQAVDVANQLADMGCEIVTLAGGEPTVRKDWDVIAKAFSDRGVYVNMITNGVYKNAEAARDIARRALAAGMGNVGVSLDGPEAVHDAIRGAGSFQKTLTTLHTFREMHVRTAILTTVSKHNLYLMRELKQLATDAGANIWRLQLALPMGVMDDHRADILEPKDLLYLMPLLAELKTEGGIDVMVADSLGYYGSPDKELRGRVWKNRKSRWKGCQAGLRVVGIEADGGVKGCLSMQAQIDGKNVFLEGNLKENTLEEIWTKPDAFAYNRQPVELTGKCGECKHGTLCRGGARCVGAAMDGCLTEDRYCYSAVADIHKRAALPRLDHTAAIAATAILLAVAPMGCDDTEDPDTSAAYGVPADISQDADQDATSVQPAYGVPVDIIDDQPEAMPAYGVPQDVVNDYADMQTAYGVPQDMIDDMPEMQGAYGVPVDDVTDIDNDSIAPAYGVPADN